MSARLLLYAASEADYPTHAIVFYKNVQNHGGITHLDPGRKNTAIHKKYWGSCPYCNQGPSRYLPDSY